MEKTWSVMLYWWVLMFVSPIISTFFGALGGWVIGLVFEETIKSALIAIGMDNVRNVTMWQLGAGLGFFGGYFRSAFVK